MASTLIYWLRIYGSSQSIFLPVWAKWHSGRQCHPAAHWLHPCTFSRFERASEWSGATPGMSRYLHVPLGTLLHATSWDFFHMLSFSWICYFGNTRNEQILEKTSFQKCSWRVITEYCINVYKHISFSAVLHIMLHNSLLGNLMWEFTFSGRKLEAWNSSACYN